MKMLVQCYLIDLEKFYYVNLDFFFMLQIDLLIFDSLNAKALRVPLQLYHSGYQL